MGRSLKVYVASALCSSLVLVSPGLTQTVGSQNNAVAVAAKEADTQPPAATQSKAEGSAPGEATEPEVGCPVRLPLTPDGDVKVTPWQTAGADKPPTIAGGISATSRCPMPPIQARPVIAPGETAQWVGYQLMFNNIDVLNRVAEEADKKGDHEQAYGWRNYDGRAAGLNDTEGQIVNEVAVDCIRALKRQDEKIRAALRKFRLATGGDITAPLPEELYQLNDDRIGIIKSHMDQLSEALGSSSFQKLDNYVSAVFTPKPQNTTVPSQK